MKDLKNNTKGQDGTGVLRSNKKNCFVTGKRYYPKTFKNIEALVLIFSRKFNNEAQRFMLNTGDTLMCD